MSVEVWRPRFYSVIPVISECGTLILARVSDFEHYISIHNIYQVDNNSLDGQRGEENSKEQAGRDIQSDFTMSQLIEHDLDPEELEQIEQEEEEDVFGGFIEGIGWVSID